MGGFVLAKRQQSKVELCQLHTGSLQALRDVDLFNKGPSEELTRWFHYRNPDFAPQDQGLIVLDFDQKWMGDFQNYTQIDLFLVQDCLRAFHQKDSHFKKAFEAGIITGVELENSSTRLRTLHPLEELNIHVFSDFLDYFKKEQQKHYNRKTQAELENIEVAAGARFLPKGWQFEHFPYHSRGLCDFSGALIERGFDLEQVILNWQDFHDKTFQDTVCMADVISSHLHNKLAQQIPNEQAVKVSKSKL